MGFFVGDEVALKGSHLALVEERTIRTAPQIDEIVDGIFSLFRVGVRLEGCTYLHASLVHELTACELLAGEYLYLF